MINLGSGRWIVSLLPGHRVTIPAALRQQFGWRPGTRLRITRTEDGRIRIWKPRQKEKR